MFLKFKKFNTCICMLQELIACLLCSSYTVMNTKPTKKNYFKTQYKLPFFQTCLISFFQLRFQSRNLKLLRYRNFFLHFFSQLMSMNNSFLSATFFLRRTSINLINLAQKKFKTTKLFACQKVFCVSVSFYIETHDKPQNHRTASQTSKIM